MARNALERRIRRITQSLRNEECYRESYTGFSIFSDTQQFLFVRLFWATIIIASSSLFFYQTYERVQYFLSYPVEVDVHIEQMNGETFPQFTFCSFDTYRISQMIKFVGINPNTTIQCATLMENLVTYEKLDMDDIWEASNVSTCITKSEITNSRNKMQIGSVFSPRGICSTFYSDEPVKFGYKPTVFNIDISKSAGTCHESLVSVYITEFGESIDGAEKESYDSGSKREIGLLIQKYNFLNRPKHACVLKSDYQQCVKQCQIKLYKKLSCRFPFVPRDTGLPTCNNSPNLNDSFAYARRVFFGFLPSHEECKCISPCNLVYYDKLMAADQLLGRDSSFSFYYRSTYAKVISERFVYDGIALLSDIGGNMGLCFGLSILQLMYWLYFSIEKKRKDIKASFTKKDPLLRLVRRMYQNIQVQKIETFKTKTVSILSLCCSCRHIVTFFCILCTVYLLILRTQYYFTFPTSTLVKMRNNDDIEHPIVTVCWENHGVTRVKRLLAKIKNLSSHCSIELLDFMDPPLNISAEDIWQYSTVRNLISSLRVKVKMTEVITPLPYGNCLSIKTGTLPFAKTRGKFVLARINQPVRCDNDIKVIISSPEEMINPIFAEHIPERTFTTTSFALQIYRHHNRFDDNNSQTAYICRSKCIMRKIIMELNCTMPYIMGASHLPSCKNSQEAKVTEYIYFRMLASTNPEQECGCPVAKQKKIYNTRAFIQHKDVVPSVLVFQYRHTLVEEYFEVPSYNLVKLLSEFGGNYSSILGLSIISTLEIIIKFYQILFVRAKKKQRKLEKLLTH